MFKNSRVKIDNLFYLVKKRLHKVVKSNSSNKSILFIVGCQRSGTTLLTRIFEKDINTSVYGEFSKLSTQDKSYGIRLNPIDEVKKQIDRDKGSFIVLKPLVESQNITDLLEHFNNGIALWVYRNFRDVASSDLKKFGGNNGIDNLRPIVENEKFNWRSEKIFDEDRKLIKSYFSEEMDPNDAAVLFWYIRNKLFFDQELLNNPRVILCKYEDLIEYPNEVLKNIYLKSKQVFPGEKLTKEIHNKSIKKGKDLKISKDIEQIATEMLCDLDQVYQSQRPIPVK